LSDARGVRETIALLGSGPVVSVVVVVSIAKVVPPRRLDAHSRGRHAGIPRYLGYLGYLGAAAAFQASVRFKNTSIHSIHARHARFGL